MTDACPFHRALDPAHRAEPYSFYAALPPVPVRADDGRFVVRDYEQVLALLHDLRLSSAARRDESHPGGGDAQDQGPSLLALDPPEHDRLRRIMMRQFGPPHRPRLVADLEGDITARVHDLIDSMVGRPESDIVADLAHPLPLAVICRLMNIPAGDEVRFGGWVASVVESTGSGGARSSEAVEGLRQLGSYLVGIAAERRGGPGTDILSGLVNDDGPEGRLPEHSVGAMARLLLIAGHETTVNLISNGVLTLLRHPAEIALIRNDPARAALVVEELLRFEPPVQFLENRTALTDLEVAGVSIPKGSTLVLVLAGANRDASRFPTPDEFDPGRRDNRHLGFGSGIHNCFGAPLARLEGQVALRLFFERVRNPRLAAEPSYRPSPLLRGPAELRVALDGVDGR